MARKPNGEATPAVSPERKRYSDIIGTQTAYYAWIQTLKRERETVLHDHFLDDPQSATLRVVQIDGILATVGELRRRFDTALSEARRDLQTAEHQALQHLD